ncbi:hypothetical protein H0H93_006407, partial [Arthromyces matolae]
MNRAFAVIIGINKYMKEPYRGLKSAVSDADRFESWLISELGLPNENITSLRNEKATGKGIREALHGVLDNRDSDANNATIIFYFAGHVSTANAQRDRRAFEDEAQMLLPYDFDANLSNNFEGSWSQPGCGIMQVELGNTMESLSQKKPGLGFVTILDCCRYSDLTVRGFTNLPDYSMPAKPFPMPALRKTFFANRSMHILLAACPPRQVNFHSDESRPGLFTSALLEILRKENLKELTYQNLIKKMDHVYYEFHGEERYRCEGFNLDRVVFTQEVRRPAPTIYEIKAVSDGLRLEGGTKNLIAKGARFSIHTDKACTSESLITTVVAREVETTVTHCSVLSVGFEPLSRLPHDTPLYAIQTQHRRLLLLFIDQKDPYYDTWKTLIDDNFHDISIRSIHLVGPSQEADLAISTKEEQVVIE